MNVKINAMYFSPTDTTQKIISGIARKISDANGGTGSVRTLDFTLPESRNQRLSFTKNDLLVIGVPVYAGRVPNILLNYLNTIMGNGALAVAVVVYGNRNYDDALIELRDILVLRGFIVMAGGAFVGEHSFSETLGANRPDDADMGKVNEFASQIYSKISTQNSFEIIDVKGNTPYRPYYVVKNENDEPVYDFRKITPKTNGDCTDCKICVEVCPMGSIDYEDVSLIRGVCIKCCACIKKCPVQAKYFDAHDFIQHRQELELTYQLRRDPELFV
jgi:ferredoxin